MGERKPTILDLLTKERINKAFQKTSKEISLKEGKFILVTEEFHQQVTMAICEIFTEDEVMMKSLGVDLCGEFGQIYFGEATKQNMSIAILEEATGKIMAVRMLYWQNLDEKPMNLSISDDENAKIISFFNEVCDKNANVAERFNTKEIIHFNGLAVPREYRRRGLATKIMEFSIQFLRNLDIDRPLIVKGETSSNYSMKVYEKFGFELLAEQTYKDFEYNGKMVFKNTGEHKSTRIYAKKLN